ncbi:MAG: hypothetical protein EOP88_00975 [Verrucomicrobiaceae bacterium]|nr:MAG: hypothetical protein EOP88_00975 [Verrucomicrobiaceae bacterium]
MSRLSQSPSGAAFRILACNALFVSLSLSCDSLPKKNVPSQPNAISKEEMISMTDVIYAEWFGAQFASLYLLQHRHPQIVIPKGRIPAAEMIEMQKTAIIGFSDYSALSPEDKTAIDDWKEIQIGSLEPVNRFLKEREDYEKLSSGDMLELQKKKIHRLFNSSGNKIFAPEKPYVVPDSVDRGGADRTIVPDPDPNSPANRVRIVE